LEIVGNYNRFVCVCKGGWCNYGLNGRETLLKSYKDFRPAVLSDQDIDRGDGNAICFAAFDIDRSCFKPNTVQIVLDFDMFSKIKFERENPCIFFKQKDLGYALSRKRSVKIGEIDLDFFHTDLSPDDLHRNLTGIDFFLGSKKFYAQLPHLQMISSNFAEMNSILAMNFFRFLDASPYEGFKTKIYAAFATLDDEQLKATMLNIAKNISDTMEFNFYGAFLINPQLIKEINIADHPDHSEESLKMNDLIESLRCGNFAKLQEAKEMLPELFQSYRFIDFLLEKIQDSEYDISRIVQTLEDMRSTSKIPLWRKHLDTDRQKPLETQSPSPQAAEAEATSMLKDRKDKVATEIHP